MRTVSTCPTVLAFALAVSAGCNNNSESDDPTCTVGSEGCPCGPAGECFSGLECFSNTCVDLDGDNGTGSSAGASSGPNSTSTGSGSGPTGPDTETSGEGSGESSGTGGEPGPSCAKEEIGFRWDVEFAVGGEALDIHRFEPLSASAAGVVGSAFRRTGATNLDDSSSAFRIVAFNQSGGLTFESEAFELDDATSTLQLPAPRWVALTPSGARLEVWRESDDPAPCRLRIRRYETIAEGQHSAETDLIDCDDANSSTSSEISATLVGQSLMLTHLGPAGRLGTWYSEDLQTAGPPINVGGGDVIVSTLNLVGGAYYFLDASNLVRVLPDGTVSNLVVPDEFGDFATTDTSGGVWTWDGGRYDAMNDLTQTSPPQIADYRGATAIQDGVVYLVGQETRRLVRLDTSGALVVEVDIDTSETEVATGGVGGLVADTCGNVYVAVIDDLPDTAPTCTSSGCRTRSFLRSYHLGS